jgi:hypothetical protein
MAKYITPRLEWHHWPFHMCSKRVVFQQRRFHTTSVFEREGQVAQTGFEPGFQRLFGRTRKGYVGRPDFYEENGAVEIQQLAQRGDREIYFLVITKLMAPVTACLSLCSGVLRCDRKLGGREASIENIEPVERVLDRLCAGPADETISRQRELANTW